jgi:hypothetical protein
MKQNFNGQTIKADKELLPKIIARLDKESRLSALRRRTIFLGAATLASAAVFIFSGWLLQSGLRESGFVSFFSLLFSDFRIIFSAFWQNFILALLESIPVGSLIFFLLAILFFLELSSLLAKNIKIIGSHKQSLASR